MVKFWGRFIDAKEFIMDPNDYNRVQDECEPETAVEHYLFLHWMARMVFALSMFAQRASLLYDILKESYKVAGRGTKKAIVKYHVNKPRWSDHHSEEFTGLQEHLQNAEETADGNPDKICAFI